MWFLYQDSKQQGNGKLTQHKCWKNYLADHAKNDGDNDNDEIIDPGKRDNLDHNNDVSSDENDDLRGSLVKYHVCLVLR